MKEKLFTTEEQIEKVLKKIEKRSAFPTSEENTRIIKDLNLSIEDLKNGVVRDTFASNRISFFKKAREILGKIYPDIEFIEYGNKLISNPVKVALVSTSIPTDIWEKGIVKIQVNSYVRKEIKFKEIDKFLVRRFNTDEWYLFEASELKGVSFQFERVDNKKTKVFIQLDRSHWSKVS
jgi:hypothetical protein